MKKGLSMVHITRQQTKYVSALMERFTKCDAKIGVIGLGYVGLPLLLEFHRAGFDVVGLDVDPKKIALLGEGKSYIRHISADRIKAMRNERRFFPTTDFSKLAEVDAIIICVPTPLTRQKEPDLSYIISTARTISENLKPGQLVVLESTTYPGTTSEVLKPFLENSGLQSGKSFFLCYSPEREDPGRTEFATGEVPKVVGGESPDALELATALYSQITAEVVPVNSTATAEAVKLTENIFRAVNIALVNELKIIYSRMGIDIWEVIEAAKTKPFGFMPFYPGPGLGGHCIPIDPYYLAWKAREFDVVTHFIELAGEINTSMPRYVVDVLTNALNERFSRSLNGSRILLLGIAYKKNVDDTRESPALKLIELLEARGARVDYFDPYIPVIAETRDHPELAGRTCITWDIGEISSYSAALICTDHDQVDYEGLVDACPLVVDTRNVTKSVVVGRSKIVKA